MQHEEWKKRSDELKNTPIKAITVEEFEMTHGMAAPEPRFESKLPERQMQQYPYKITQLRVTLEGISKENDGNTPRLGLYGDMSWDLVNMETDEWILGGDNVYTDIAHIVDSYQGFSNLERELRDKQLEKVEFNRRAIKLHQENELRRNIPKKTNDAQ